MLQPPKFCCRIYSATKIFVVVFVSLFASQLVMNDAVAGGHFGQDDIRQFEQLRFLEMLDCSLQLWAVKFRDEEGNIASTADLQFQKLEPDEGFSHAKLFIFDNDKTRAIVLSDYGEHPNPGLFDAASINLQAVEPDWEANSPGALVLPYWSGTICGHYHYLFLSMCHPLHQTQPCQGKLRILAEADFAPRYPVLGFYPGGTWQHGTTAGFCSPQLSRSFAEKLGYWKSNELCGWRRRPADERELEERLFDWDVFLVFMYLGSAHLILKEPNGSNYVQAYKWFKVYQRHITDPNIGVMGEGAEEEESRLYLPGQIQIALDIAAERMTPDQIEEANELAENWNTALTKCDAQQSGATTQED